MNRRTIAPFALVVAGALALLSPLSAAAAELPSKISFSGSTTVSAVFGSDWVLPVHVEQTSSQGRLDVGPADGTVDFLVEGIAGEYVTAAPIYPGGVAYFAQPSNEPPLAAGTYTVTAIFTPAAGGNFAESRTATPVEFTITPLAITPSADLLTDPAEVAVPTVRTSLSGEYLDVVGAPPSGTWTVTGVDSEGADGFTVTAEQPTEAVEGEVGSLDIPITDALKPGETYTVTTRFDADPLIAPGLEYENAPPATFTTTPLTFAETLSIPIAVPIWLSVLCGVLLAGLVALFVLLVRTWSKERREEHDLRDLDAATLHNETLALTEAPASVALPTTPTQSALPPGTSSWSLSDDETEPDRR